MKCQDLAHTYTIFACNMKTIQYSPDGTVLIKCPIDYKGECVIPEGVIEIGHDAFSNCDNLTSVVIPNSVRTISTCAFCCCWGLTSVVIPEGVNEIGRLAFAYCKNLISVILPDSVTKIGDGAFSALNRINMPLYNANVFAFIPHNYKGEYEIPYGIKTIAGSAFAWCSGLTSVSIPDSVTEIGRNAFIGCSNLTSIEIPDSVKEIGFGAFFKCTRLKVGINSVYK